MQVSRDDAAEPPVQADALTELRALAVERASRLGHDLDAWEPPPDEDGVALRASCRRCGRTVYVRAEPGLGGIAGHAARERCR
jgi:hypothetical protein